MSGPRAMHRHQRGASMLMAVVFLLIVIALFGLVGLRMAGTDITDTSLQNDSVEALFLAESGLERAIQRLSAGTACTALAPDATQTLGRGDFQIQSGIVVGSLCRVRVLGRVLLAGTARAQRTVEGDLAVSSSGWAVGQNGVIYNWNGSSWTTAGFTNGAPNRTLNGLYCISSSDCWAVGQRSNNRGTIVRLTGTTWSNIVPPANGSPNTDLNAVHCLSSMACWAVGDNGTILYWNGSIWDDAGFTNNSPARDLFGVYCVAANNCWAVGESFNGNGLIIHWDGNTWDDETGGNFTNSTPGVNLAGIHCVDAANCWAVGEADNNRGTIVRWNAATNTWSNAANNNSPDENLNNIYCASATECWAVGDNRNSHGVIVRWNGSNWTNITAPANGTPNENLYSVYCIGSGDCWTVGNDGSTAHLSGATWAAVGAPTTTLALNAVSFPSGGGGSTGLQRWREIIQ